MNLMQPQEIQRLIDERVKSGAYKSPEDVLSAGIVSLHQQERGGDFADGELEALLDVADAEIERGELLDGEEVFRGLRELGKSGGGNGV